MLTGLHAIPTKITTTTVTITSQKCDPLNSAYSSLILKKPRKCNFKLSCYCHINPSNHHVIQMQFMKQICTLMYIPHMNSVESNM